MRFAERMSRLTTAASFDMLARGRALEEQGRSIIHLGIGEPDFDTPAFIRQAADAALAAGYTHYGPPAGLPELRERIAQTWRTRRAIPCEAANVIVTPGAKPILFFAMLALLEDAQRELRVHVGRDVVLQVGELPAHTVCGRRDPFAVGDFGKAFHRRVSVGCVSMNRIRSASRSGSPRLPHTPGRGGATESGRRRRT